MLDWAWIGSHLPQIASRTGQHIQLAGIALIIGFARVQVLLTPWTRRAIEPIRPEAAA